MDMITKLMQPQVVKNASDDKAKIIEIESTTFVSGKNATSSESLMKTTSPKTTSLLSTSYGYGFNSRHTHVLSQNIGTEFPFLTKLDTSNAPPSKVSHDTRRKQRLQEENEHFDADRYMCDFVDMESNDFTVANALKMKSPALVSKISDKDDTETLRRLARHSKPLVSSSLESRRVCSTLCDIIFA